jgi:hypothetical protein
MRNDFCIGLDLGQANEYTALAIVERVRASGGSGGTRHFHLRHLERFPLRTPYPTIADRAAEVMTSEELTRYYTDEMLRSVPVRPELVVDQTGVGAPACDLLKERGLSFGRVVITAGEHQHRGGATYRVPKADLVTALKITLQNGYLKVAEGLGLWPILREEMKAFKRKVSLKSPPDSLEHWREGDHDDLVLAVCLACWGAARSRGFAGTFGYTTGERIA